MRASEEWRSGSIASVLLALAATLACSARSEGEAPERIWLPIGGETFELELALDEGSRRRGLSGRSSIERSGGMLFVLPQLRPFAMVMRDCPGPIDVAFLDTEGVVVAVHEMSPEAPRRDNESALAYERRLRVYPSGVPVQFAIETAGGRLREVGLAIGQRVGLDAEGLIRRAR